MLSGWDDIGYNFLIGGTGQVFTGRGWNKVGAHTYGFNRNAIAFSLMGNYENNPPPQIMLDTLKEMIEYAYNNVCIIIIFSLYTFFLYTTFKLRIIVFIIYLCLSETNQISFWKSQ